MIATLRAFWRDEHGGLTPGFLFFLMIMVVVAGTALNFGYTRLQKKRITRVAEAMALELVKGINNPLITRKQAEDRAFLTGKITAGLVQPAAKYKTTSDVNLDSTLLEDITTIKYGRYDYTTLRFVEDANETQAVVVQLDFKEADGNPLKHMFYFGGKVNFDLSVRASAEAYIPSCAKAGIFAKNQIIINGFASVQGSACLRANGAITIRGNLNADNEAEVSAPSANDMTIDNFANVSPKVLQFRVWQNKMMYDFHRVVADFETGRPTLLIPEFPLAQGVVHINASQTFSKTGNRKNFLVVPADELPRNRIIRISNCSGDTLLFKPGIYSNMVIIAECAINFEQGARLREMILLSKRTGGDTLDFKRSATIGTSEDACKQGSGTLIWSLGHIGFRNDLTLYNTQLISGKMPRDASFRYDPERPWTKASLGKRKPGILVENRLSMTGSTIMSEMGVRVLNRAIVRDCPNHVAANRWYRPYFRNVLH